jgi:hypothetical protein
MRHDKRTASIHVLRKDYAMLKKIIFAGLVFFAIGAASRVGWAAGNQDDPGQALSTGAATDNRADPPQADAAAVAAIEPAAGGGNVFTATLDAQKKADKRSQDPDPQATAAEKTRRNTDAGAQ